MNLLEIKDPSFVKDLSNKELLSLVNDIRTFLIENVSVTGGHLSSNLGVVELTIAMHYVFSSPKDKLIFDVGHQCYTHKILTGRAKDFTTLRQYNGLTGFINKSESLHDQWESGHSSTSLSAACGFLCAEDKDIKVVSLIGDASISNGVSFEAMNYMASLKGKAPIIILNDNKMSISKSVGAVSRSFSKLRSTKFYQSINNCLVKITPRFLKTFFHSIKTSIKGFILKENLFEDWGYDYMGPYDGNDLQVCIKVLSAAKRLNKPCVVHFVTKKGKGYKPAEDDKDGTYHGVGPFDIQTGVIKNKQTVNEISFSSLVAHEIKRLITEKDYFVINPAMIKGSELDKIQLEFPQRVLDVGMAEEHAAVMASAIAQSHKNVILMLYSTFAQRAYDFLLNDIARTNAHVIVTLDRADFVPGDGSTHQGIYDIAMINSMPNFMILAPRNAEEVTAMFDYASNLSSPTVIRYAKKSIKKSNSSSIVIDKVSWEIVKTGQEMTIVTYGENVEYILDCVKNLDIEVINARFIKPLDEELLSNVLKKGKPLLIYENSVGLGGFTSSVYRFIIEHGFTNKVKSMCLLENSIVPTGDIESLRRHFKLSKEDILRGIDELKEK